MNYSGVKQVREELQNTENNSFTDVENIKGVEKSNAEQATETANNYKEKVTEYTQQGLEKAGQLKRQAADFVTSSSDYVKNFDFEETKQQLRTTVKKQPELSIAIAGVVGFVIGLIVSRKKK